MLLTSKYVMVLPSRVSNDRYSQEPTVDKTITLSKALLGLIAPSTQTAGVQAMHHAPRNPTVPTDAA